MPKNAQLNAGQTREEQAVAEIGHTAFTQGSRTLILAILLVMVGMLPLIDVISPREASPKRDLSRPSVETGPPLRFPSATDLKALEKRLESASLLYTQVRPTIQSLLTSHLHIGSYQAILGRDDWLFYRPDIEHLTGPPFLSPAHLSGRGRSGGAQPDPLIAIRDFHRQLRERDIGLIIVPIPSKAAIETHHLAGKAIAQAQNPSLQSFLKTLASDGILAVDLHARFLQEQAAQPRTDLYLRSDTHWTPRAMQLAASVIADLIAPSAPPSPARTIPIDISHQGDLVPLLGADAATSARFQENVRIEQVTRGSGLWRPDPAGDTLLLGDSFTNIFSLSQMGWGESAGLAEHLSHIANRPIDAITRNNDGAFATRESLAAQLARGRDRLAGKRWVIWTFAERELSFGDWKPIALRSAAPPPEDFLELASGTTTSLAATVAAVSHVPRPNSVAYPDHLCSVHLVDITPQTSSPLTKKANSAIVLMWSMRNRVWTDVARWRPGDRVSVKVRPWSELEPSLGKINQSNLEDPSLMVIEPLWAEPE